MEILLITDTYLSSVPFGGEVIKTNNDSPSSGVKKANKIKESGAVRRKSRIYWTGPGRGQQGLIKVRLCWSSINLLCFASDLKLA